VGVIEGAFGCINAGGEREQAFTEGSAGLTDIDEVLQLTTCVPDPVDAWEGRDSLPNSFSLKRHPWRPGEAAPAIVHDLKPTWSLILSRRQTIGGHGERDLADHMPGFLWGV
jgi:hypothetical protein